MKKLQTKLLNMIKNGYNKNKLCWDIKKNRGIGKEINNLTTFIQGDITSSIKLNYCIQGLTEIKKCKCGCGENIAITNTYVIHHEKRDEIRKKKWKDKLKKTCTEKYGENYRNIFHARAQETNLKKYGTKSVFNDINWQTKSLPKIIYDKYGVDNISKLYKIKNRKKQTYTKNYNCNYNTSSNQISSSISSRHLNTYNKFKYFKNKVIPLFKKDEYDGGGYNKLYNWKCIKCNNEFSHWYWNGLVPRCPVCYPKYYSYAENEINQYLSSLNIIFNSNNRSIIQPLELDMYIPDKNIAIEFNGTYWHSELRGKTRNYHLNKTKLCEEKNIQLIHIFEDEWLYKQQIVKSRLKHILGLTPYKIYARKCAIKEIDSKLKNKFLNKYHIQGNDKSSIKLGAFYKNRLVAVMTFGKRRFDKKEGYELIRFCTLRSFNITGIAGKLLKYFKNNFTHKPIISYADRRWSIGNLYKQLGFKLDHISTPNYFYMKNYNVRESRIKYQKHKLKNILKEFNPNLSEWQNMQLNGYDRIWDCGNYVFTLP